MARNRKGSGILLNTCHISVFTNSTSEKTSSSGSARTSLASEVASSPNSRVSPQKIVADSPYPTIR